MEVSQSIVEILLGLLAILVRRAEVLNVIAGVGNLFKHVHLLLDYFAPFSFADLVQLLYCFLEYVSHNRNILLRSSLSLGLPDLGLLDLVLLALMLQSFGFYHFSHDVEEASNEVIGVGHVIALPCVEYHLLNDDITLLFLPLVQGPYVVLGFEIVHSVYDVLLDGLDQHRLRLTPGMLLPEVRHGLILKA